MIRILLKNILFALCFIFIFSIVNTTLFAQISSEVSFENLSLKEGLSHGSVWAIIQDKSGFLWVGTEDGLNKFDGIQFKIYRNDPKEKNSLVYNYVKALFEDHKGVIWVGTRNGLSQYNKDQDTFTNYIADPVTSNAIAGNTIQEITEDSNGNLWFATRDGGLSMLNTERNLFKNYRHNPDDPASISSNTIWSLQVDRDNNLWVGTIDGFNKLDVKTGKFTRFMTGKNLSAFVIYMDRFEDLWIGTWGQGLMKFNTLTNETKAYRNNPGIATSLVNDRILAIYEDKYGDFWVGTSGGGLDKMDRENEVFNHFKHSKLNNKSLSHNYANIIYEDKAGSLWIGTWGGGLNKYDRFGKKFHHFYLNPYDSESLSNNEVSKIFVDSKNMVWVGTVGGGLNMMDPLTKKFTHFENSTKDPKSISSNVILTIYEDKEKYFWVGTEGGGLNLLNRKTNKFTKYDHDPDDKNSLSQNDVRAILEDRKGNVWIGTWGGGLNLFNKKTRQFKKYLHEPGNPISLSNNFIRVLYEDKNGVIWIGTNNGGLNRMDTETNTFTHYVYNPHDSTSLSHNAVTVIHQDQSGAMWIGTRGGLNRFDLLSRSFELFNKNNGLPNDQIHGILEDEKGFLWISTNKGLSKFNPSRNIIKNYNVVDGIQSDQFKSNSYCQGKDGFMYFGGINGFNVFHPDSIVDNNYVAPVVITNFKLFNKPVSVGPDKPLKKQISETERIILSHEQTFFSFEFAALNFIDSDKNEYAYKLENFDENWIHTGSRRIANYTNIPPGKYIFKVKAANNDGVWNEEGAKIEIIITPPFWETWWFISFASIVILGSALGYYKNRIYQIKKQKKVLEELVKNRTEEIVNKSNEIKAQRDYLEEAQKTIFEQNIKLTSTNLELEKQVELRTKELKEAYQDILMANEELDMFIYRSAHDLQGPIARLMGLCYVAKLEVNALVSGELSDQNGAILQYINKLENASKEMKYILARIIRTRKMKNKDIELEVIDFSSLIDAIIKDLGENKDINQIVWNINIDEKVNFHSDEYLLKVLLSDLIGNALNFKSTEADQNLINISVQNDSNRELLIIIQDNGIGIPGEISLKLFDMFFVGTEVSKGSGLGLYEAKIIVEKLKGRIFLDLSNKTLTEFKIFLPFDL